MAHPPHILPNGTVPPKHMNHRAITGPRVWPWRCCCSTVIMAVVQPK